jgi:hypothetical protein
MTHIEDDPEQRYPYDSFAEGEGFDEALEELNLSRVEGEPA